MNRIEALWEDSDYRHRIATLASRVRLPFPLTCSLADVHEYRAHLVMFRLHNEIGEHLFNEGMEWAAAMQHRIAGKLETIARGQ